MQLLKYEELIATYEKNTICEKPIRVPVGFADGVEWLPLDNNVLVVGGADIGRSSFLRSIVFHTINYFDQKDVQLWLYDAGLGAFNDFSRHHIPHISYRSTENTPEAVKELIDVLDGEITSRLSMLLTSSQNASQNTCAISTGERVTPKGIVVINCAEIFFKQLHNCPKEYLQKMTRIVQASTAVDICVIMCIHDYSYFIWPGGIDDNMFPQKIAIVRNGYGNSKEGAPPVKLITDNSLPQGLCPIRLSQHFLAKILDESFVRK